VIMWGRGCLYKRMHPKNSAFGDQFSQLIHIIRYEAPLIILPSLSPLFPYFRSKLLPTNPQPPTRGPHCHRIKLHSHMVDCPLPYPINQISDLPRNTTIPSYIDPSDVVPFINEVRIGQYFNDSNGGYVYGVRPLSSFLNHFTHALY